MCLSVRSGSVPHLPAPQVGGGRWGVGEVAGGGGKEEEGARKAEVGGLWFGLVRSQCFGSVRCGSGRFDTLLGESIVETAMKGWPWWS